jgi:eukaryotic-like serine/threonine-protein kinase
MLSHHDRVIAGRYRITGPVGQGGMGRVWLAHDGVLGRDVALKELVPPPGLSEDQERGLRARSMREARALALLSHPNVVKIFDVLQPADGDPWLVMEYVTGRSLQQVLDTQGPLPAPRAAQIGLGVLAALEAAHRVGIVHRDVKPGNVLLADDGRVVLTDFGLATVPGDPSVTGSGPMFGSPSYMAPERALSGTAGPACDLWSLGATLYAAVEGHPPYPRPTAIAVMTALASEPVPPPRRAGPLKQVLAGLLRKEPDKRLAAADARLLLRKAARRWPRPGWVRPSTADAPHPAGVPAAADPPAEPDAVGTVVLPEGRPDSSASAGGGHSRRRAMVVALALLPVVLAALVLIPLLSRHQGHASGARGAPTPTPGSSAASASGPASAVPSDPGATQQTQGPPSFTLPAGWSLRDDGTGFRVPVPDGWHFGHDSDGRPLWQDPGRTRLLLIDQTRHPKPDPVQDWLNNEAARRSGYAAYHRIRIVAVDYWDKAADWEFTYLLNGTRTHVLNRGFITAPDQAYSIYWSTPDSQWADSQQQLNTVLAGFQPART